MALELLSASFADAALELGSEESEEELLCGVELQSPTDGDM